MVRVVKDKNESTILSSEEINSLKPDQREIYIRNVINDILKTSPNGVTISDISEMTSFNRLTIGKHLEHLASIREAYKKEDRRGATYFKNGRLVHPTGQKEIRIGSKAYAFIRIQNNEGEFFYIQEKEEDMYKALKVKGGILIPMDSFQLFLKGLIEFTMKETSKVR